MLKFVNVKNDDLSYYLRPLQPYKNIFMRKHYLSLIIALFAALSLNAQVTSGTITGSVKDNSGKALAGATVQVVHEPSGTKYKTVTTTEGIYNLPALRIGGPYKLTISYVGYTQQEVTDIFVQLGDPTKIDISMLDAKSQLTEVVVAGSRKGALISKDRKGTSTNFGRKVIAALPTLSRSFTDITKYTPQSNGTSFAGQDNRFINLTIDGSIFNNSFGLQALPGSQTNSAPISLDAIEEITVNISPYSVKEAGFTGAGISAVTRSGTNTLHGSGFYNTRNEGLVGRKAGQFGKQSVVTSAFDVKQYGASLSGAIIKNKLFFFANYEGERRTDPGTAFVANNGSNTGGANVTRVLASDLTALSTFLKTNFNYETGAYDNYTLATRSDKALVKIDWNISDKHKFSLRGNALKSLRDVPMSGSGSNGGRNGNLNSLNYQNSNYEIHNDIYSLIGQLNSRFSNKVQNDITFGYTANRDYRAEKSISFPTVDIQSGGNINYISFGSEPFTPNNTLNTDTWQFSDNLTVYQGKHTVSAGVNFESFKFFNQFTPQINGQYIFNSLADFYTSANAWLANKNMTANPVALNKYVLSYSNLAGGALWAATTKAYNAGFYLMDELPLSKKLNITYGARFDVPFFGNTGYSNSEVDGFNFVNENGEQTKLSTSQLPSPKVMFNPRLGFNYDVKGDKSTQIRGGAGLFSGRPAFVFISNQMGNNGVQSGQISITATTLYPFSADVKRNAPVISTPGLPAPSYNIAVTEKNFRFPQVFRSNLAIDQKLPGGIIASAEVLFTQSLSNIYYYNANLKTPSSNFSGPDNRPRFNTFNTATGTILASTAFNNASRVNPKVTDATVMKSGAYGKSFMTTFKLERPSTKGISWMVAYNFGNSQSYIDAATIAYSSWSANKSVLGNNQPYLSYSDYDTRHRVIGTMSYRKEIAKTMAIQFNLGAQTQNQGRYSYTVNGDLNGDGISGNDLLYIPRNTSEMNFEQFTSGGVTYTPDQQKGYFERFIANDPYLKNHRGEYAQRNGGLYFMVPRFDLSSVLEIFQNIGKQRHTIQLRADIFNIGNMFNSSWGVGYNVNTTTPIKVASKTFDPVTNQPLYQMVPVNGSIEYATFRRGASLFDVWQAQLGLRYTF